MDFPIFKAMSIAIGVLVLARCLFFLAFFPERGIITWRKLHTQNFFARLYNFTALAMSLTFVTLIAWLYILWIPLSFLIEFLTGPGEQEKKDGVVVSWCELEPNLPLQSDEYRVSLVKSPIGKGNASAGDNVIDYFRKNNFMHFGLCFESTTKKDDVFIIDYQASKGMFNAITPQIDVGFRLNPPSPETALLWNNAATVFRYDINDPDYWESQDFLINLKKKEVQKVLKFCLKYKKMHPLYVLSAIRSGDLKQKYYGDSTCTTFMYEILHYISQFGDLENVKNLSRSVMVLTTKDNPVVTKYQTTLITSFFKGVIEDFHGEMHDLLTDPNFANSNNLYEKVLMKFQAIFTKKKSNNWYYTTNQNAEGIYVKLNDSGVTMVEEKFTEVDFNLEKLQGVGW